MSARVVVHMEDKLHAVIARRADAEQISVSAYVRRLLLEWAKQQEGRSQ